MLTGYKSLIVAAIWLAYEIASKVVPEFQVPDQGTITAMVNSLTDVAGPIVMAILRLRTTTPVGPAIANAPLIGALAKTP